MNINFSRCLEESIDGIAYLIMGTAIRAFSAPLAIPLWGIGLSLLTTKLVLNFFDQYNYPSVINLTRAVHTHNKNYPQLERIALIFAFCISFLFPRVGLISGLLMGCCEALLMRVENYKALQAISREKSLKG